MNRCNVCEQNDKDSCVCVPYGCECFKIDLEEHDKHIRKKAIDEFETRILSNCSLILKDGERVIVIRQDIFKFIIEQMQKGEVK